MGLLLRTLVTWLLVLALPAQGAAAATMAACGPNHHGGAPAAQVLPGHPAEHSHHAAGAQSAHTHHHDVGLTQASAEGLVAAVSASPTHAAPTGSKKCSACAACCSVTALPSAVLSVPPGTVAAVVFSAVITKVSTFTADGPERPPRIALV